MTANNPLPPWPAPFRRYAKALRPVFEAGFQGICFDLDGVLIHTMPFHAQAWLETAREAGLHLRRSEVYQWEGEPGTATAKRLLSREGRRAGPEAIRRLLQDKEERFAHMSKQVEVEAHWLEVLQTLHGRKVPIALVTGTSMGELQQMLEPALLEQFHAIVTGDRVTHGKPHPEPYAAAFRELGIEPARSLVIENAPYGIRSGQAAGAGCVLALKSSLPAKYLQEADVVVHRLDLLQRLLIYCSYMHWLA